MTGTDQRGDDVTEDRDERISREVLADVYTANETALSWYFYLHDNMQFPFQARCTGERAISPLKTDETVRVEGMPPEKDCMAEPFFCIEWEGRKLGVPASQLEPVDVEPETARLLADWHYWSDGRTGLY